MNQSTSNFNEQRYLIDEDTVDDIADFCFPNGVPVVKIIDFAKGGQRLCHFVVNHDKEALLPYIEMIIVGLVEWFVKISVEVGNPLRLLDAHFQTD